MFGVDAGNVVLYDYDVALIVDLYLKIKWMLGGILGFYDGVIIEFVLGWGKL